MDEIREQEVRFDRWCKKCEHENKKESKDPCNDCLAQGWNEGTTKPIHFKEKS
jgi:hypothetical protein